MKKGFSLLELMVSIGMLCLISWVALSFFLRFSGICTSTSSLSNQLATYAVAQDLLFRDTAQANSSRDNWYNFKEEIIFSQGNNWIGWQLKNKTLWRTNGLYTSGGWHEATKSVVLKGVTHFSFTLHGDADQVRAIEYEIMLACHPNKPLRFMVALRTGDMV